MNGLFIANLELKETEGIYKKVCAQADAIGQYIGECNLVTRKGRNAVFKRYHHDKQTVQNTTFYDFILENLVSGKVQLIYVRHMIPSFSLLRILKKAKKLGVVIYYEIPTYPYFGEQYKASRKKYRAIAKIGLDVVFWPAIYYYIDHLVVIRSNSKSRHFNKMVEITNGVRVDNIESKIYFDKNCKNKDTFSMVTVGTLYPYHGYDRILKGLAECQEKVDGKSVEFHVVGSSQTIDEVGS